MEKIKWVEVKLSYTQQKEFDRLVNRRGGLYEKL